VTDTNTNLRLLRLALQHEAAARRWERAAAEAAIQHDPWAEEYALYRVAYFRERAEHARAKLDESDTE